MFSGFWLPERNDDRREGSEFASGAVYTPKIYNTNDGMFSSHMSEDCGQSSGIASAGTQFKVQL